MNWSQQWHNFWHGQIGEWILTRGLRIVMLVLAAMLAARFVNWIAQKITQRIDADFRESDALVRSETTKHRQAVASVISWVTIAMLVVIVFVEFTDILAIPHRLAGGTGRGDRCRARFRRPAAGAGSAVGFLHHHREAVRLR